MIVRLDLEAHAPTVSDVDDPRIFLACLDQHLPKGILVGLFRGEKPEKLASVLVGAVLRPHDRKNPELGQVRHATQNLLGLLVLLGQQPVFRHKLGSDLDVQGVVRVRWRDGTDSWLIGSFHAHADANATGWSNKGDKKARRTPIPSKPG